MEPAPNGARRNSWTPTTTFHGNQTQIHPSTFPLQAFEFPTGNDIKQYKWQRIKEVCFELAPLSAKISHNSLVDVVSFCEACDSLANQVREVKHQLLSELITEKERENIYNGITENFLVNPHRRASLPWEAAPISAIIANSIEPKEGNSNAHTAKPYEKDSNKRRRSTDFECDFCGSKNTPEWRRGPSGKNTLCNACGLKYAKQRRAENETKKKLDINWILNSNPNKTNNTNNSNNNNNNNSTSNDSGDNTASTNTSSVLNEATPVQQDNNPAISIIKELQLSAGLIVGSSKSN